MIRPRITLKLGILLALLLAVSSFLTGCATQRIAPVSNIETMAGAINVPYRISSSGRILIDVSINEGPLRPLSVDTGASVSVLYSGFAKSAQIDVSDRTLYVRGLVGQGDRPIIEDVVLQIGHQGFAMERLVLLETPRIKDEAIGLLGGDILGMYTALFNRETMMATFVPRDDVAPEAFAGWNRVPLRILTGSTSNTRLYFANTDYDGKDVPVLIDTGSNLNFINWKLATLDTEIRQIERNMIRNGTLQGALDTTSATIETVFKDLKLGRQEWDEIPVVVMGLNALETVAPVDEPMMVIGADVLAPLTVAFDLAGLNLYIRANRESKK